MSGTILIIDDSPTILAGLTMLLEAEGFTVITADCGEKGVETARREKPDLVIIDTMMPGIDGFETCRRIRETEPSETIKIINTTSSIDAIDAVKARRMGADDYCVKSMDLVPLVNTVKNLMDDGHIAAGE